MDMRICLIGRIALGGVTLAAAWAVMTITIGSTLAKARPRIAATWSPHNAEANGYLALQLYNEDPMHPRRVAIIQAAQRALARAPANVNAVVMMAAQADAAGQKARADQLFTQSDRMSRHDLITQLYLIETAVARGDINTALRHYDAALSTSHMSANLLAPVLVAASADPAIAGPLARLLARRPIWWSDFARRLVHTKADPGASFPLLLRALRLDPRDPAERTLLSAAIGRLTETGHGDIAYALYRQAMPGASAVPLAIRNGTFEMQSGLPPFDWEIREAEGVSGVIQPLGQGKALFVSAESGVDTEVASQQLLLAPGRYVLSARIGSEDRIGGETGITVNCPGAAAYSSSPLLGRLRAPANSDAKVWRAAFTVPVECTSQRLAIIASPADQSGSQSWVNAVTITRAR